MASYFERLKYPTYQGCFGFTPLPEYFPRRRFFSRNQKLVLSNPILKLLSNDETFLVPGVFYERFQVLSTLYECKVGLT